MLCKERLTRRFSDTRSKASSGQCDLQDIVIGANEAGLDAYLKTRPPQLIRWIVNTSLELPPREWRALGHAIYAGSN